jgi:hypothetical protein
VNHLPYLLPWVRDLFLICWITSTDWDEPTRRRVQPLLRRALELRRQIARDGWWDSYSWMSRLVGCPDRGPAEAHLTKQGEAG